MTAYTTYQSYYRYDWRFTGGRTGQSLMRTPHRIR
ncbi:hypothetical protein SAMN05216600_111155 [Pseudomonas cuatrocienegasensis]|uniref:Uncharacterized protein n=1 Tax=Pseudomonas cuatrocienegasensis TaxID=543360 RepID=A0ABY1BI07_9PSED|nr:hypothetical protein SAMN05216600_111155 [Pseudomonas cuatrocienegasensis]